MFFTDASVECNIIVLTVLASRMGPRRDVCTVCSGRF